MREPKVPAFFVPPHLLFYSLFIPFYFPFFNTLLKSKGFLLPFRQENVSLHKPVGMYERWAHPYTAIDIPIINNNISCINN